MINDQIIQEATEAVTKGYPCAFYVPQLLEVIKNKEAEIFKLKEENANLKSKNSDFLNRNEKAKAEIEKKDTEIEILIRKKEALRDEISELTAEVERLQKIIVGFMDEVGTWSNKYDVDISNINKLPLLAKEDFNIKNKIKSEAYKEFAEKLKSELSMCRFGLNGDYCITTGVSANDIDNTLKELTRNLHETCTETTNQTATNQSVSLIDGHIEG